MLPEDGGDDPEVRLAAAVPGFLAMIPDTEPQQRTMLRLSLDPDSATHQLPLRQGRAIGWFSEALEPLAPVWLIDVAGMSRGEAVEQMVWSAEAPLRRAVGPVL